MMKFLLPAIAAIFLGACSTKTTAEADTNGWHLIWEETFNGESVDTAVWSRIPRGTADWNNYMTDLDTCYALRDGKMTLRGIAAFEGCNDTAAYLTGGLFTKGKMAFDDGRIEICARFDSGKGAWPAIWLLPDPAFTTEPEEAVTWPNGGEIDVMEHLNFDTIAYQTVHSYYTLRLGLDSVPPHFATGRINRDDFNVYAVEMLEDSLKFYINDIHTFTYPRIATDLPGQFPFTMPYYLLIDMQLGGSWVGEVDPKDLPVEMEIDWVRFYRKNP